MSDQLQIRNRAGAVLRRTGFRHLPCLGAAALRARRDARLRLRAAPRHRTWRAATACSTACRSLRADWAAKTRREPHAGDSDAGRDFRHRADARRRDRDGRGRPAQHLRARPQSGVSDLCRGAGLPARHHATSSAACARPIIPAIRIAATRPSRRCRPRSISAWTSTFELHTPLMWLDKAATWKLAHRARRGRAGRSDPRTLPHLLSRRTRRAARLGLWLRRMPGLRVARQGLARICGGVS